MSAVGWVPFVVQTLACIEVLRRAGISVAPGSGFGPAGEGYFRISLTVPDEDLRRAMDRLGGLDLWSRSGESN